MTERETVVLDEGYSLKQVRVMLKLCEAEPLYSTEQLKGPDQATEVMADALARLDREYCCVVNLDSMLRPINFNVVSIGGISRTLVPVQNVFKAAILSNAAGIMLFHNHPSGSLTPSREDVLLTQRLVKAGQLMEIPVLDHVIVGGGGTGRCSLRSEHPKLFCVEEPETYCGGQDKAGHLREPFEITEDRKGDKNLRDEEGCRGAASVAGGKKEDHWGNDGRDAAAGRGKGVCGTFVYGSESVCRGHKAYGHLRRADGGLARGLAGGADEGLSE